MKTTFRRDKSLKLSLRHLNDCHQVFKEIAKTQNITDENEDAYIKILLHSYIKTDNVIEQEKIEKYRVQTVYNFVKDLEYEQKIKNIRI